MQSCKGLLRTYCYLIRRESGFELACRPEHTPLRYTPLRCTSLRCTPMRGTPPRYLPVRDKCPREMYACERCMPARDTCIRAGETVRDDFSRVTRERPG